MVTAKSLQLLDQYSNNISPLTNIETLYYEKASDNGLVYRQQVFKHFPVYVSYNGEQQVSLLVDENKSRQFFLNDIINDYNQLVQPYKYKDTVLLGAIYEDYNIDDNILNDKTLLKNNNSSSDIIVSAIIQSRLSNTDYYKLDVSNYNLSKILDNYALESLLYAAYQLLDTEIYNNLLYDSPNYTNKNRPTYTTIDAIGGIDVGTDISTLVGKTYSEILDSIITPVKEPGISDMEIGLLGIPNDIVFSLEQINQSNKASFKINTSFTYMYVNLKKPEYDKFTMNNLSLSLPGIVTNDLIKNDSNIALNTSYTWQNNVSLLVDTNYSEITINTISTSINSSCLNNVYKSDGNTITIQQSKLMSTNLNIVLHKTNGDVSTSTTTLRQLTLGTKITTTVGIKYPILYGDNMKKLNTAYISTGLRYNQVCTQWNSNKKFYIAVPLIILRQLVNGNAYTTSNNESLTYWTPTLYKIKQQGHWQSCNNWIVSAFIDNYKTSDVDLTGFRCYMVAPTNKGEEKTIKFIIDTTKYYKLN